MLKRIKEVLEIGGIKKLVGCPSIVFKKITIIFGLNAYGKTILADIFHAISNNDAESIKNKKSIPNTSEEQKIDFSFLKDTKEQSVIFENGDWKDNFQKGNIFVFDNDFIHKNLIAGVKIDRENKEGFTSFVFGEESVKKVKEIEKKNEDLKEKKKSLKKPNYVSEEMDDKKIDKFVDLKVTEKKEELEILLLEKRKKLENISRVEEIQGLLDITKVNQEDVLKSNDVEESISELNKILDQDYTFITDEVLNLIKGHIQHKVKDGNDGSQKWIAEGTISYSNSEDCPFCGQNLSNVNDLMQAYNNAFNDQYKIFLKRVENSLDIQRSKIEQFSFIADNLSGITQNIAKYQRYDENINTNDFRNDEINSIVQNLNGVFYSEKRNILSKINQKIKTPHSKITPFSFSENFSTKLEQARADIFLKIDVLNKAIEKTIQLKKEHFGNIREINKRKDEIEEGIKDVEIKIKRLEQDNDCKNYKEVRENIDNLKKEIKDDKSKLEAEQSQYVKNYFDKLNENYRKLGNNDFSLSSKIERRGNIPVCTVVVKLNDVELSNKQIPELMSDSEKRSLAFAVFLTKLNLIPDTYKGNKIVILDDSVVSFDDNRITNTVLLLKEISSDFRQVIFFTHYKFFVTELCNQFVNATEKSILELKKGGDGQTMLVERGERSFTQSEIEKSFEKLDSFGNGEINEDVSLELRIYVENFLKIFFQKKIKDQNIQCSGLGDLINKLESAGIIDSKTKENLNSFNLADRGNHHTYNNRTIENKKSFVKEVLRFCSEDLRQNCNGKQKV